MEDLEISYCTKNELVAVKKLWQEVFGDDEIWIDRFFYHLYQDNILIAKVKGKIVAMATLLSATFLFEQKEYAMRYVYACATTPLFRGKKIMSKILDKAFEDSENRGEAGLFLLPADAQLYDFYLKNGFSAFFYHDKQEFSLPDFAEKQSHLYNVQKISAEKYYSSRNSYLQNENSIHYPLSHFQFIDDSQIHYPAKFYEILYESQNIAITLIEEKTDYIAAKEFLCKERNMEMLYAICQYFGYERIALYTLGKTCRDALLRSNEKALLQKGLTGYFNMALD